MRSNGFAYDPIFFIPKMGITLVATVYFACLSAVTDKIDP
ncbi:inosine/xanthosine triphosphate pyrophosphatase family protein [Bacillus horti]|uniref:Inosine/xanthosine triphosphate pyrophosphatase family protein n=1 Tax=Caldalkalibacillus horti TaxID=77523 RepID=A0ABT9W1K1_9BACI|nr:inosine/xanthosine triphosphate pyrophosphatase family protein [Bacillus horti]